MNAVLTGFQPESVTVAFNLFGIPVAWYGICIGIGFIVCIILSCLKIAKMYKMNTDPFYYFCIIGIPISIIGARIGSVVIGQTAIGDFFAFRDGGLSILYAVAFCILSAIIYFNITLRKSKYTIRDELGEKPVVRKISMLVYFDAIAPTILVGQFIGRFGNYVNGELYGSPISKGWYRDFVNAIFPLMNDNGTVYQPLFIYEGLLNLIGFILLFIIIEKFCKYRKTGDLFYGYLLWYGIVRLFIEAAFRQDVLGNMSGHIPNLITSILQVVLSLGLIICNHTIFLKLRKYDVGLICFNTLIIYLYVLLTFKNEKSVKKFNENKKKYFLDNNSMYYYRGY